MVKAGLTAAKFEETKDPRKARGRRWRLSTLLETVTVGLMAGKKSLAAVEALTKKLSLGVRRCLEISRRVADTTLRDILVRIAPDSLRGRLHAQVKAARRSKALQPDGLPIGVVSMDGKSTTLAAWDNHFAERRTCDEKMQAYGLLRTISCCLISAAAKVCLDAIPLLAGMNEVGFYQEALRQLVAVYGTGLFQLVCYDAGGCSEENADFTISLGLHYLFAIKANQPGILDVMHFFLGRRSSSQANAFTQDVLSNKSVVTRRIFLIQKEPLFRWSHARTFIRVDSEIRDRNGNLVQQKTSSGKYLDVITRYFLCSMEMSTLTPSQWLLVVRRHWAIENNLHGTLDVAFAEDDHPFMPKSPLGSLNVMLLRRIAYNALTLFRSVTCRSEEKRKTPWAELFDDIYVTLVSATIENLAGLRPRVAAVS
jgi:predicted transposase YbfD/YdcC